jgi:hypothetical protein
MSPLVGTVALVAFTVLVALVGWRRPETPPMPAGVLERERRSIRRSAPLVALGMLLVGVQAGAGYLTGLGFRPPVGIVPLQVGLLIGVPGLLVGVAGGTARYRVAACLVFLGVCFAALIVLSFSPTAPPGASSTGITIVEIDLLLAALTWLVAFAMGASEFRSAARAPEAQAGGSVQSR